MKKIILLTTIVLSLGCAVTFAQTPEEQGREIARQVYLHNSEFRDLRADLLMLTRNAKGKENSLNMQVDILQEGRDSKALVRVNGPEDMQGTALLTHSSAQGDREQWLYMPALGKVKRIAVEGTTPYFMDSDLGHEIIACDIKSSVDVNIAYLKDDMLEGKPMFVVEIKPTNPQKFVRRVWVDQTHYRPWRVEYLDAHGMPVKTLAFQDYHQHDGQYWRADQMVMTNHRTGEYTQLTWKNYDFRVGLNANDFAPEVLH